jgi:hypothetical protein
MTRALAKLSLLAVPLTVSLLTSVSAAGVDSAGGLYGDDGGLAGLGAALVPCPEGAAGPGATMSMSPPKGGAAYHILVPGTPEPVTLAMLFGAWLLNVGRKRKRR